ncbi:MAG: hypothetical protein FWD23_06815 [Oscillospiraceae bacterium]|nr:hypothetical protein [Oscillospiraceae bacterium]
MKKIFIAALVLALMMPLCVGVYAFPASKIAFDIPYYENPVLDGNITPGDYSAKLALSEDISHVWAGDWGGPVDFYFAWNESGLIVAFDTNNLPLEVKNETRTTHGDNADRPQISINPGNMFDIAEVPENNGYFFTFTVGTDDKVVVTRDNVAGNALGMGTADDGEIPVTGGFAVKGNSWSAEYLIPWSEIDINGTNLKPAPGMPIDINIFYCCVDGCWGTRLESSENPWGLADNAFTMNLLAAPPPPPAIEEVPEAPPAEETPAPAPEATAPAPAPAPAAPATGDTLAALFALILVLPAALFALSKKRKTVK